MSKLIDKLSGGYCVTDLISLNEITLISCSEDETIKLWNLTSGRTLRILSDKKNGFMSLALLKENTHMASGSRLGGAINIWDLERASLVKKLYGHTQMVSCVYYLQGDQLASSSTDRKIKIWNYQTGTVVRTVHLIERSSSMVLLPNGLLASAGLERSIRIWNFSSGHLVDTF
jgi:WD40 repeat protein